MVGLLGTRDELLHVIEREFSADIHVRGNEITVSGPPAETELIGRLFSELLELQRKGAELSPDTIERTVGMLRGGHGEPGVRPADVLTQGILSSRGRTIRPKTLNQKHYADAIDKHTIVFAHRPGRHRQDLPRDGQGGEGAAGQGGQPDHPDPPGRRGGRAPRLPARHALREDRPVPAAALRRPARHGGPRVDPQAHGRGHDRDSPAGLHAGPQPQRLVHHPRRGAEHHARADEDVPHPPRVRVEDRGDRRRHPGRPARRPGERPARGAGDPRRHPGHPLRPADEPGRRPAQAGREDRRRLRAFRRQGQRPAATGHCRGTASATAGGR